MSSLELSTWLIASLLAIRVAIDLACYGRNCTLSDHIISRDKTDSHEKRWRHRIDTERYLNRDDNARCTVAIAAMQGLLSDQREGSAWSQWDEKQLAERAYRYADAMLAARDA
jgi:hypothetical protein